MSTFQLTPLRTLDSLPLLHMTMRSSLSVCSVDSAALSTVADRRGGGSAAGWTGTDRLAARMGPSAWRGTSDTLGVSLKSRRNFLPVWAPGILRPEKRKDVPMVSIAILCADPPYCLR